MNLFVWDPTEPIATRPLFTIGSGNRKFFYTYDGNKNVSELVHFETRNGIAAHYDYAPFGAVTRAISASAITDNTFTTDNPFRFSSEYHDDTLGLVYYRERERTFHGHYRHYNPINGRWISRDPMESDKKGLSAIIFCLNNPIRISDRYGLYEYETVSSHEVSLLPVLGGDFPGLTKLLENVNTKLDVKNIQFSTDWSLNGTIRYEKRKCCDGPLKGQEVIDQIWNGKINGGVSLSVFSHRNSFEQAGVSVDYWMGLKGSISGGLSGFISGESNLCSGEKLFLKSGIDLAITGEVSGGIAASISFGKNKFLTYSVGAVASVNVLLNYSYWQEKHGEGAWITTKSEWDDLSVNLSIQTDFGFATYLFEKQLY